MGTNWSILQNGKTKYLKTKTQKPIFLHSGTIGKICELEPHHTMSSNAKSQEMGPFSLKIDVKP